MKEVIKILVVDDTKVITKLLYDQINKYYSGKVECYPALSAKKALSIIDKRGDVNIVISDFEMPKMDGIELLRIVKDKYPHIIRVLMSGHKDFDNIKSAVNDCEIASFVEKPWNTSRLFIQLDSLVKRVLLARENEVLINELQSSIDNLKNIVRDIIVDLSPDLAAHSKTVSSLSLKIANELKLSDEIKEDLKSAALFYTLGLLGLPKSIYKTHYKQLNQDMREMYFKYPQISAEMLKSNKNFSYVRKIIKAFHENLDGSGPLGLYDKKIPLESKILKIADEYTLAISIRGRSKEQIIEFLSRKTGILYDKNAVKALVNIISRDIGAIIIPMKLKEVKPGMTIGRNIVSELGRMLLPKGTIITMLSLKRILIYNEKDTIKEVFIVVDN